jgi:EAL and modified HD-GYP domain-containing signal transduction protein
MGLFSLLDVILQKPMSEAITEVAVDTKVLNALLNKSGEVYEVLELVTAYERCDWYTVAINLNRNRINSKSVSEAFFNSLVWYCELLESMEEA